MTPGRLQRNRRRPDGAPTLGTLDRPATFIGCDAVVLVDLQMHLLPLSGSPAPQGVRHAEYSAALPVGRRAAAGSSAPSRLRLGASTVVEHTPTFPGKRPLAAHPAVTGIRAIPDPPCVTCQRVLRCAAERPACSGFVAYVEAAKGEHGDERRSMPRRDLCTGGCFRVGSFPSTGNGLAVTSA